MILAVEAGEASSSALRSKMKDWLSASIRTAWRQATLTVEVCACAAQDATSPIAVNARSRNAE
ncbi:MAG: hypothetical protein V9G24_08250 [Rhodoblastus sp.]